MTIENQDRWILTGCYSAIVVLVLLNISNSFFWDTVQLASKHGTFFYNSNFKTLLLPDEIDSGHIPAFGAYIALVWKIFGRTLEVSHLAVLPFAIGIVYQLQMVCRWFINHRYASITMVFLLCDSTLLSQMTLVSPDVPLVFFFLCGLNALLKGNRLLLGVSVVFLFLISMRGMMISVCFVIIDIILLLRTVRLIIGDIFTSLIKRSLAYLPAAAIFTMYNYFHFDEKGWIGFHENSPWAPSFEPVGFNGFLYNVATLGWRLLDYGRIGIWIVFTILLICYWKFVFADKKLQSLTTSVILFICILPANMLWAKGLMGQRYLLPVFIIFALLTASILFSQFVPEKKRQIFAVVWLGILLSGHFWKYPVTVSQGWDSTVAHLPYYELRHQAIDYLENEKIDFSEVGSFFPNSAKVDFIDLNGDERNFEEFDHQKYIFYSNVYNVSDAAFASMQDHYRPIRRFENAGIYVIIYKKDDGSGILFSRGSRKKIASAVRPSASGQRTARISFK